MNQIELLSLSRNFLSRIHAIKKGDVLLLRELIREHNHLYYGEESPVISDTEYDQLFHALARAESDYNMIDDNSPTAQLAVLASEQFQKVQHMYPMISLDNTYSLDDVADWNDRMLKILEKSDIGYNKNVFQYYIQPKYDGLGLALIYEYGVLKKAITRGSGREGEDVTLTAFEIQNLPKNIPALQDIDRIEVRGEVMMSRTTFTRVNQERLAGSEKLFANPRNAASGSLRQLDPLVTRARGLQFFAYSIPQIEQSSLRNIGGMHIHSYTELMGLLVSWGFERADFSFSLVDGLDNLLHRIDTETKNRREYFDFDIDGMVLKLDTIDLWEHLGRTEHHPRYAIAYKFPAKQVRTRVLSIEHSVGRTGTVTPVANLEPVDVSGVIVRRATLHNYDELSKKGVMEGDYVFIMRAGEVIPEIVCVIPELRDGTQKGIHIPDICPICNTKLEQDTGKVAIYCSSMHCGAKIQGQLEMFVSKQGLNIDGFGEKQIALFIKYGWITDFSSIFQLYRHQEEMLHLDGYKEKSVQNLMDAIHHARNTTLDRILTAIGIPNVGKKTAKIIANFIIRTAQTNKVSILDTIFILTPEELLTLNDIGPETACGFVSYMQINRGSVENLFRELTLEVSHSMEASQTQQSFVLEGKSFCVTGSFDVLSRDEIHELIERHGGEVRTSVSVKLDYLITGENSGSKRTKADELGVTLLSLENFLDMIS